MQSKWLIPAVALGLFCCTNTSSSSATDWRRTAQGWVRETELARQMHTPVAARVHPGVLASLEVLVSLGGLLLFSSDDVPPAKTV